MSTFPWGYIVKKHVIGPYEIIEYIVGDEFEDRGKTQYHHDGTSYHTLKEAMLGILCGKDYNLFPYAYRLLFKNECGEET